MELLVLLTTFVALSGTVGPTLVEPNEAPLIVTVATEGPEMTRYLLVLDKLAISPSLISGPITLEHFESGELE